MEMTPGFLARSIAGNDKDKIYVISEDLGTYVSLLAENGRVLRKNKKQVAESECTNCKQYIE